MEFNSLLNLGWVLGLAHTLHRIKIGKSRVLFQPAALED